MLRRTGTTRKHTFTHRYIEQHKGEGGDQTIGAEGGERGREDQERRVGGAGRC
jgi:hypothetical protein